MRLFPEGTADTTRSAIGALGFFGVLWTIGGLNMDGSGTLSIAIGVGLLLLGVIVWLAAWIRRDSPKRQYSYAGAYGAAGVTLLTAIPLFVSGLNRQQPLFFVGSAVMVILGLGGLFGVAREDLQARAAAKLPPGR